MFLGTKSGRLAGRQRLSRRASDGFPYLDWGRRMRIGCHKNILRLLVCVVAPGFGVGIRENGVEIRNPPRLGAFFSLLLVVGCNLESNLGLQGLKQAHRSLVKFMRLIVKWVRRTNPFARVPVLLRSSSFLKFGAQDPFVAGSGALKSAVCMRAYHGRLQSARCHR